MKTDTSAPPAAQPQGPRARMRRHDWIDERSRALAAAVADHVRRDPAAVRGALARLDAQIPAAAPGVRATLREWRDLLATLPLPELLAFMVEDSERATRLRQSLPFAGVLPPVERDAIFRHFETL